MAGLPNQAPKKSNHKLDYMSQLPDALLQHILFFLPAQDAARASILSQTWLRVWKSLPVPVFTFSFDMDMPILDFVTMVDRSLSPLQNHMAIIQSFTLEMTIISQQETNGFVSCLDNWVCLVIRNCIRQLYIKIYSPRYILLPEATFTSKSLTVLKLYGCKLPSTPAKAQNLSCLKQLSLVNVSNEDQIQNLISCCSPFLERLTLILYHPMKCLVLDNFQMLRYVYAKVKILMLDAANLNTLKCLGLCELHTSIYTINIKKLKCCFSPQTPDPNNLLREIVSKFSLLEHLIFNLRTNVRRFSIQHSHLKTLHLYGIPPQDPCEVEIDAPNLYKLHCLDGVFPYLSVVSPSIKECETLQLYIHDLNYGFWDGSHIHHLGIFLQNFNQSIEVNLEFLCTKNILTLEQLQERNVISCPSKVRKLVLSSMSASSDYTSFLDGLFWTCHPTTLLIEKCLVNGDNFIKFLCRELLGRQENPACCRDNLQKCWRHFLKGVVVQCYKRLCEPEELVCLLSSNLSSTLSMCDTGKKVEFSFEWLEDPVCSSI